MEEYRTIEGAVSFNQAIGHYRNVEIDEQSHVSVGYPVLSFDYRTSDARMTGPKFVKAVVPRPSFRSKLSLSA